MWYPQLEIVHGFLGVDAFIIRAIYFDFGDILLNDGGVVANGLDKEHLRKWFRHYSTKFNGEIFKQPFLFHEENFLGPLWGHITVNRILTIVKLNNTKSVAMEMTNRNWPLKNLRKLIATITGNDILFTLKQCSSANCKIAFLLARVVLVAS